MVTRCLERIEIGLEKGLCFMSMNKSPSLESISMDIEFILLEIEGGYVLVYVDHHLKTKNILFIYHLSKTLGKVDFMSTFDLECLIKTPTCFRSSNPTCIDLIFTNKKEFFIITDVIEVGFFRSTDHRPTNHRPLTQRPTDHRSTDPLTQ